MSHTEQAQMLQCVQTWHHTTEVLFPRSLGSCRLLVLLAVTLGNSLASLLLIANTIHLLNLGILLLLRIPLPSLQHEHAHEDKGQDGVTSSKHLEAVLAADKVARVGRGSIGSGNGLALDQLHLSVGAGRHDTQALDNVGNVDNDAAHVQHETGAVKQHVRLRGLVQLEQEPEQTCADDNVQDAADDGRAVVDESQVRLQKRVVWPARVRGRIGRGEERGRGPQDIVIVGKEGKQEAEEEACCCRVIVSARYRLRMPDEGHCLRPMIRKVAKGETVRDGMMGSCVNVMLCGLVGSDCDWI